MIDGAKIRELRTAKGYTSRDVSRLSKEYNYPISKSYLEELERGVKLNPSFNKIEVLAEILCVKMDELIVRVS